MKLAVISNESSAGRKTIYRNLMEVLADSKSMECMNLVSNEEAIDGAEYLIIVTTGGEASLALLKTLINEVEAKGKAYGVVINKAHASNQEVKDYCLKQSIKVLEEIELSDAINDADLNGLVISREDEVFRMKFLNILNNVYMHMANLIFKLKTEGSSGCGDH